MIHYRGIHLNSAACLSKNQDDLSSSDQLVLTLMAGQTFPSTVISYSTTRSTGSWGTKKKPYRYRWPDEIRDEVLARLLALTLWDRRDD